MEGAWSWKAPIAPPSPSQVYGPIPPSTSYPECCLLVERLPPDSSPEVCGLPPSLDSELRASESRELQDMLHTLQFPAQGQRYAHIRQWIYSRKQTYMLCPRK